MLSDIELEPYSNLHHVYITSDETEAMTSDSFDGASFSAANAQNPTTQEFIDLVHDPDILYYYIKDAYNKVQQDLTIDPDSKDTQVNIHANVEVFQSAIQYVEAFGIYLTAYIKNREELIDHLIKTRPGDVEEFFEAVSEDNTADWLDENASTDNVDTVIREIYGYAYADPESVQRDGEDLTEEELDEAIERSVSAITTEINRIGEFYTIFHPIYNAVKHGNRAIPQNTSSFEISPSDDDRSSVSLDPKMNFVMFVCKNRNGDPYLTSLPIDYLIEHTLEIIERTHRLFTQVKSVSEAAITDETFDLPFYTPTEEKSESSDEETDEPPDEWITAQFAGGIIILPRLPELESWVSEPLQRTAVARLEITNGNLTVTTDNTDTISEDYPIETTITQTDLVGLSPQPIHEFKVSFTLDDLDARQYHEILKLQDATANDESLSITVIDDSTDTEFALGTPEQFPVFNVPEFLPREEIEQIALLQTITQRHLPVPLDLSDEQRAVIQDLTDENPTREDAIDAVEELERLGNEREMTLFRVEKRTPEGELLEETIAAVAKGTIDLTFTHDETGDSWTSTKEEEMEFPLAITGRRYHEVVAELENDIDTAVQYLNHVPRTQEDAERTGMKVRTGIVEENFWGRIHELTFQVPGDPNEHSPQPCPLCKTITRNLAEHLLSTTHLPV